MTDNMTAMEAADPMNNRLFPKPNATPLRFKSTHDSSKRRERDARYDTRRHRHRRHRHRASDDSVHKDHKRRRKDEPQTTEPKLDPDAAFHESLFDAMADDEGAEYWQSVYGQPIHEYPKEHVGPEGELERMTDEEYVEFVRAEMWKKTNAGLLEEKERRAKARKEAEEREREARDIRERMSREDNAFRQRVDASLRKGRERAERRSNREAWEQYQKAWDLLGEGSTDDAAPEVPWPMFERGRTEPGTNEVAAFMRYAVDVGEGRYADLAGLLKAERVRWHPDKVQQRAKGRLDEQTVRRVTAVFQIIDDLWMEHKK